MMTSISPEIDRNESFSSDAFRNFRALVFYLITASFLVVGAVQTFATQPLAPGLTAARIGGLVALAIFAAAPVLYKLTGWLKPTSAAVLIAAFSASFFAALSHGGAPAPTLAFFALIPLGSTVLLGRSAGVVSLFVVAAAIVYCGVVGATNAPLPPLHTAEELSVLFTSAALLSVFAVAIVALSYEALAARAIQQTRAANKKLRLKTRELAEREGFLSAVMETVHDGISATDTSGKLTILNRAAREGYGEDVQPKSPAEWQTAFGVYQADGKTPLSEHEMPLLRALHGENVLDEQLIVTPDGFPARRLNVSATPIRNADLEIVGAVATTKDITVEHEQREEIRRQNLELDQFARVASHDLQAPLRGIVNLANKLSEKIGEYECEPELENDLIKISRSADKMRDLIRDVLYMSRLSSGQLSLQPVSPRDCIEAALDLAGVDENDGSISYQVSRIGEVNADPRGLTQVYLNLITNARKFCRKGEASHIEFTCEDGGESLILGVRDNGIGISEKDAERIFMPTERLHTDIEYDGTGLGLAICRNALTKMGGDIWVESKLGEGAHFRFRMARPAQVTSLAS